MTGNQLGPVLDYLWRSTGPGGEDRRTDGQLLDRFTATGDEAAFEALVRRHGRQVLSVCRSVLGNSHDAEDAFQATFLVLVKRAGAIDRRESVRSWLYGVAHRVAVRARAARVKNLRHESEVPDLTWNEPTTEIARNEIGRLVHEEVVRLPEHYRLPVLLCCLEGKSRRDAARELGLTEGVVKGRLERGRKRLLARLARRGLTPAALTVVGLARGSASACVPRRLALAATKAARQFVAGPAEAGGLISDRVSSLTYEALRGMGLTRLRASALGVLLLLLVGTGAWLLAGWILAGGGEISTPAEARRLGDSQNGNVLGFVAPQQAARPGAVMLHGGGRITEDAFNRFVELAGGKEARIVVVPSAFFNGPAAFGGRRQFEAAMKLRFSSWFRLASAGRVKSVKVLATDDPADADDRAFVRPLATATGVWFCGGDQARLNYRYVGRYPNRTRFQEALRDVVARGGIVGGTSAGMAALPEIMTLDQERRANGPYRVIAAHGLGLFDGAIVEQHFDARLGRLERFTGLLRDSARLDRLAGRRGAGERMVGLAVEGSTALVLQGDRLEVLGGGSAHVFVKAPDDHTITWHTLSAGRQALLKRDARGQVVLFPGR